MSDQILAQIIGPTGALVLAVVALAIVWRQSRADLAAKDKLFADQLASKNADIEYERAAKKAAEVRLESLGGLLKDATALMEKSIDITEKVIERREHPH